MVNIVTHFSESLVASALCILVYFLGSEPPQSDESLLLLPVDRKKNISAWLLTPYLKFPSFEVYTVGISAACD